jgi:hypothetical protein
MRVANRLTKTLEESNALPKREIVVRAGNKEQDQWGDKIGDEGMSKFPSVEQQPRGTQLACFVLYQEPEDSRPAGSETQRNNDCGRARILAWQTSAPGARIFQLADRRRCARRRGHMPMPHHPC